MSYNYTNLQNLNKKANAIFMDTRTGFNTNKYEKQVDAFAMNLLVGDDILLEYL